MDLINKIKDHKNFNDYYCLTLSLIALLGWQFNNIVAFIILMIIGVSSLVLFNNLKYLVPIVMYFPLVSSASFMDSNSYIGLIICGSIFIVSIVGFLIMNKMKFKFDKNALPLILMAVFLFLPIFWIDSQFKNNEGLVLYLCGFLYLVIYFIFRSSKNNLLDMVISANIFFTVLLSGQLILFTIQNTYGTHIDLGWGISNESAILLCMCMSFAFYRLLKDKNKIIPLLILLLNLIGIILSFSRGGYLFGAVLFGLLIIYYIFKLNNKKIKLITIGVISLCGIIGIVGAFSLGIIDEVFSSGLDSNGRFGLYERAFNLFIDNPLNFILGSGFISEVNYIGRITVWHSTLFQTIACGGIALLGALIFHFYKKYIPLLKSKSTFAIITFIGFIVVEAYGMIDNTYYMYYYMIPFVIVLASLDNELDEYEVNNEIENEENQI